jgi:uncharacterized membrane protein YdjX (TVP38/TMEM64 family)
MACVYRAEMNSTLLRRLLPLAILLLGLALFVALGLERHFSFETLSRNHAELSAWVAANGALAALAFVAAYALAVAFSLPIALLLTPLGGFLFGVWLGALLSDFSATLGSIVVFLAARTAFHDLFHARAGAALARLEAGFRRDSFSFLLFLRLVPLFPFWLVNIVPGLLGVRLGPYVVATFIGMIPAAVIFASVGAGFGTLFVSGQMPDFDLIFQWRILLPLLGLAALSLLPVLYRAYRRRGLSRRHERSA